MADNYDALVDDLLDKGWSVNEIEQLAREVKLEKQGFQPAPGGGWVRPSTKRIVDPSPAQGSTEWEKIVAAAEGAQEGLGAHSARMAETFAFGLPAKGLDLVGLSSPEEREAAKAKTRGDRFLGISPEEAGVVSGFALSGAGGPEAAIAKGAEKVFRGLGAAAPVLTKTAPGRILSATGEAAVTGVGVGAGQAAVEGRDPGQILESAQEGGLIAAPFGAAGQGAAEVKRAILDRAGASLGRRIINEVSETGPKPAAMTTRKRLAQAEDPIVREIVHGPDGDVVRDAVLSSGKEGRAKLEPLIERLGTERQAAYGAFKEHGRNVIDPMDHVDRLETYKAQAIASGNSRVADVIEKFQERVIDQAIKNKGMDLEQIRGLTTESQSTAASVLGSLLEPQNKVVADRAQAAITAAMDETLGATASGVPVLEQAVDSIRGLNKRFQALLSLDKALKMRIPPEESVKPGWRRGLESTATMAGIGGVIGATQGGPEEILKGAAAMAAVKKGAPYVAEKIDRAITTAAINRARAGAPTGMVGASRAVAPGISAILDASEERRRRNEQAADTLRSRGTGFRPRPTPYGL